MWVCALLEDYIESHFSRWAAVTFLLLDILNTIAAPMDACLPAGDGSSAGFCASSKAQRVPHIYRWAVVHLILIFLIPFIAAPVEKMLFFTLRTRQLIGTVLLYRLYTTARR